jgi:hypothetical protein
MDGYWIDETSTQAFDAKKSGHACCRNGLSCRRAFDAFGLISRGLGQLNG